jgi:hypothetical protein
VDPIQLLSDIFHVLASFSGVAPCKICPNELGEFCLARELSSGAKIPDDLKEIYRQLSKVRADVRRSLVHPDARLQFCAPREMDLVVFCRMIDDRVKEIFQSHEMADPELRNAVAQLCLKWADPRNVWDLFPSLSQAEGSDASLCEATVRDLFPFLAHQRQSVFFVVVLTDDKRDILLALAEQSAEDLQRLLNSLPRVAGTPSTETK